MCVCVCVCVCLLGGGGGGVKWEGENFVENFMPPPPPLISLNLRGAFLETKKKN